MRWLVLSIVLWAMPLQAQTPIQGLDYLGGAKFCDSILKAHPDGKAAGFFIDTFGDSTPCIDRLAGSGKASVFRVHLAWSDTHQFNSTDFDSIAKKAGKLEVLTRKYPSARIYVSGACEHNLNAAQANLLKAKVLSKCPHCAGYVNTVWKGALIDGINEVHGIAPKKPKGQYTISTDGDSAVDSDFSLWKQTYSDALIQFAHEPRFNGRWETNDATPRPNRRGWADEKLIRSVSYLFTDKGAVKNLPGASIYKSHSENKGSGDTRAEKPVVILTVKAPEISCVTANGKVVASSRFYGTFDGGRFRYYLPSYGYELAEKAKSLSGSPLVFIRANKKNYGPVNPAFREGAFR